MSEDKTQDLKNDELSDDELEGVTGGRRLAASAISASKVTAGTASAAKLASPVSAGAVTAAKQLAGKVNLKGISNSPLNPTKGGIPPVSINDRE